MPDNWITLKDWKADAILDVRKAHERVRTAENELREARTNLTERALDARRLGITLAQIGQAMGVSRQRVHEMTR